MYLPLRRHRQQLHVRSSGRRRSVEIYPVRAWPRRSPRSATTSPLPSASVRSSCIWPCSDWSRSRRLRRQSDEPASSHARSADRPRTVLLEDRIEQAVPPSARADRRVMLVDLDRFKEINDTLSHGWATPCCVKSASASAAACATSTPLLARRRRVRHRRRRLAARYRRRRTRARSSTCSPSRSP